MPLSLATGSNHFVLYFYYLFPILIGHWLLSRLATDRDLTLPLINHWPLSHLMTGYWPPDHLASDWSLTSVSSYDWLLTAVSPCIWLATDLCIALWLATDRRLTLRLIGHCPLSRVVIGLITPIPPILSHCPPPPVSPYDWLYWYPDNQDGWAGPHVWRYAGQALRDWQEQKGENTSSFLFS